MVPSKLKKLEETQEFDSWISVCIFRISKTYCGGIY